MFRTLRGREVLRFFAELRGDGSLPRALAVAERLDLPLDRRVSAMSTGTRQKLALAAVLAADAPLVILDEPTSSLDPSMRAEVLALVREARDTGRTVIFSSHVLSEVEQVCDRVIILRSGTLVHTQDMRALRRGHRLRAQLTGVLPPPPADLAETLTIQASPAGNVTIDIQGDLAPPLAWLASLPLVDVQMAPVGLRTIYDRYHPLNDSF